LRITDAVQVNGSVGYGFNNNLVGGRAGLRVGF
jgi:hypothetical protein